MAVAVAVAGSCSRRCGPKKPKKKTHQKNQKRKENLADAFYFEKRKRNLHLINIVSFLKHPSLFKRRLFTVMETWELMDSLSLFGTAAVSGE